MGKYSFYQSRREKPRQRGAHPVWRGIGFLLILIIPVLSYAAALVTLDENAKRGWIDIPLELISPVIEPMLYAKILLTIIFMVIFYGIFTFISFALYSAFGPPRYGPLDAPPVEYRGKQYKR